MKTGPKDGFLLRSVLNVRLARGGIPRISLEEKMKDALKIIAALLPIGIKLYKDIKNAKDKDEKERWQDRLKDSGKHYDAIRRELID